MSKVSDQLADLEVEGINLSREAKDLQFSSTGLDAKTVAELRTTYLLWLESIKQCVNTPDLVQYAGAFFDGDSVVSSMQRGVGLGGGDPFTHQITIEIANALSKRLDTLRQVAERLQKSPMWALSASDSGDLFFCGYQIKHITRGSQAYVVVKAIIDNADENGIARYGDIHLNVDASDSWQKQSNEAKKRNRLRTALNEFFRRARVGKPERPIPRERAIITENGVGFRLVKS